MEVEAGPAVGLKEHVGLPAFLHGEKDKRVEEVLAVAGRRSNAFCFIDELEEEEEVEVQDSSESSSIGVESSSEDDGDDRGGGDEVQSKLKEGPLGSLDSLEESLPIKRGLSNFFTGKSKSFASLSDVASASAGDLTKPENPFNKRRRILMACKASRSRRASYSSLLPPLTVVEGEEEEEEETAAAAGDGDCSSLPPFPRQHHGKNGRDIKKAFRSPRSFSLSDLQRA